MLSPVQAVTHPDPYPYYAQLVADQPAYYDDTLRCWVFSSAAAVTAALAEPDCRVRPAGEPVPSGLVGTAAGEVFGSLVRMTDGQFHDRLKQIVAQALGQVGEQQVRAISIERSRAVLSDSCLDELMFAVPAQVVARLCGLDDGSDEQAARLIGQFVQCLPATATADQQAGAARAAEQLQQLMGPLLQADSAGLLGELVRLANRADWPAQAPLLANGIGLLSQTYDASAGLIGNCVLAVARYGVPAGELASFVREVA
ncbi:MAG: cytochrome P450, partial [Jatrophihabitantaceae bacterium]